MHHNDYMYAINRSNEYLAHYGVKGMKWGVRKAIESGNDRALARHYERATRKLNKLRDRADIVKQSKRADRYRSEAIGTAIGGVIGSGLLAGVNHINKQSAIKRASERALSDGIGFANYSEYSIPLFAGLTAADVAANGIAAKIARNRTTLKGHNKAVRAVKDWQREMNTAFKGTKYASKKSTTNRRPPEEYMAKWLDNFEKHYQTGLSKGMSHDDAERYANKKLSSGSAIKRKRR